LASGFAVDGRRARSQPDRIARKLRVQYPGAIYHVMNRGDGREPIFQDDHDRRRSLQTRRLRGETTMTLDWIAGRLNMGAAGYAAQCLRQAR